LSFFEREYSSPTHPQGVQMLEIISGEGLIIVFVFNAGLTKGKVLWLKFVRRIWWKRKFIDVH